jgi:hypothetical protein
MNVNDIMFVPNFKEGDSVICISEDNKSLIYQSKYTVTKIFKDYCNEYRCFLKEKKYHKYGYYCYRFQTELEYNANKYNL